MSPALRNNASWDLILCAHHRDRNCSGIKCEKFQVTVNRDFREHTVQLYFYYHIAYILFIFYKVDRRAFSTRIRGRVYGYAQSDLDPSPLDAVNYCETLPRETSYDPPERALELNFNFSPGIPADSTAIPFSRYRERARPPTGRSSLFRSSARKDRPASPAGATRRHASLVGTVSLRLVFFPVRPLKGPRYHPFPGAWI